MKNLDNIRSSQNIRHTRKEKRKARKNQRRTPAFKAFVMCMKVLVILVLISAAAIMLWAYNQVDFTFGNDLTTFNMQLSSTIYVKDEDGDYREYEQFKSADKRVWVDIEDVPQNMQDAFVAIEDQRFYSHHGVDIKRTLGAVMNVFVKGDSSYGGSTITQQLVKNITQDNERTNTRKIREITRALVLESKLDKKQILELYMNSIYLSQGVHGVQAASDVYFGKDVSELSLAECASIAGITQYPTTYDPIINPGNNREKQLTVLRKMLELKFITNEEYEDAINETMKFKDPSRRSDKNDKNDVQSYFSDHIFEQVKQDLMKKFDYSEQYAENLICNGGLKIYSTMDPEIQKKAENYYETTSNFPQFYGNTTPQSAIVITDPSTGHLKAIVGGRGKKENARVLNRATQSQRQPGSTIKPIAVYAPALEENIINLSTYIDNSPIKIGDWAPSNANGRFSGPVPVSTAVAWSYNMPAIRTLQELGVDKSYDYLHNKMHMESVVDEEFKGGKRYTDKNLSSLALGGLTHGVTPLEMSTAYSTIANGGMYIEPVSYTKICDVNDNVIIEKDPEKNRVFSKETAFLMQELLKGVVKYGTASGSTISGMETCGKTGTTDDNKDKWFIGFTPYYCTTVWFGYDSPKVISASANPATKIWRDIMSDIHQGLESKKFEVPSGIVKATVCGFTGKYASMACGTNQYANEKFLTGYCRGDHKATALRSANTFWAPAEPTDDEKTNNSDNTSSKDVYDKIYSNSITNPNKNEDTENDADNDQNGNSSDQNAESSPSDTQSGTGNTGSLVPTDTPPPPVSD